VIFVTVGTNEARFDRLLEAVAALHTDEELVVQYGASRVRPSNAELHDFLPFERMVELIRGARVVVTHAGVGSIMVALAHGKRPVVVPRRRSYDEAVDDHQVAFGRRFAAAGLVTYVESPGQLEPALGGDHITVTRLRSSALAADLKTFLQATLHDRVASLRTES
jgi:UDP-N-acetylglucosamine transferase subunit ALG13